MKITVESEALDTLKAMAEQDAKDAARYRFLRDADPDEHPVVSVQVQNSWGNWFHNYLQQTELDDAIDAAMQTK